MKIIVSSILLLACQYSADAFTAEQLQQQRLKKMNSGPSNNTTQTANQPLQPTAPLQPNNDQFPLSKVIPKYVGDATRGFMKRRIALGELESKTDWEKDLQKFLNAFKQFRQSYFALTSKVLDDAVNGIAPDSNHQLPMREMIKGAVKNALGLDDKLFRTMAASTDESRKQTRTLNATLKALKAL